MRNFTEADMEAELARLRARTEAVQAIDAANPEMAPRPNRKVRDQADMRIVAMAEGLKLQTRRPTWPITLASWVAMSLGLLGMGVVLVVSTNPAEPPTGASCVCAALFAVGLGGVMLHWPDGSPRSWRTRSVDPEVLVRVVGSRLPYRPSTHGVNLETMDQHPVRIWLVPEDEKASLRAMAEHGEVSR